MLFNSIEFIVFFPIVVVLYFLLQQRFRWLLLLVASYYFYMSWKPEYLGLILVSTIIDYISGLQISRSQYEWQRKFYLMLSLTTNLSLLFFFKYFNFFSRSLSTVSSLLDLKYDPVTLNVLLPVGISFYTFQTLSYTIDVYQNRKEPETHLGKFALYVSFFPQLVAGPIERSHRLLPQFFQKKYFDYERITDGLKLMLWGFFKKVVIADRLAVMVDNVYGNPHNYSGLAYVIATYFFSFQIYCDFSGYSDIAIGAAQVFGYDLMDNFKRPYFAKSIPEFWKRWHISLSTWFRDYLYLPLGGNRVTTIRWYFNIFFVFLISGLWHGANWTFVIWGGIHGILYLLSKLTAKWQKVFSKVTRLNKIPLLKKYGRVLITFHIVSFAWIFFRAQSLNDAWYIITHLFTGFSKLLSLTNLHQVRQLIQPEIMGIGNYNFLLGILSILFMETIHIFQRHQKMRHFLNNKPIFFRWTVYYLLIFSVIFLGKFTRHEFIYFQF